MRLTTPRIPPLPESEWTDEVHELLAAGGRLNLFTTLARHPKLFKRWSVFGAHVLSKSTLPVRERELLILRTGYRCNSAYEFHQHTRLGLAAGLTPDEIRRVRGPIEGFDARDSALLQAADELHDDQMISDEVWRALGESWDEKQRIDLIFTVGQYTLACMVLNSLGVQIEPGSAEAAR
ncbi:MAG TPA: carboxymuconolactone decarboxylase family protein [Polyangiales bacterium]